MSYASLAVPRSCTASWMFFSMLSLSSSSFSFVFLQMPSSDSKREAYQTARRDYSEKKAAAPDTATDISFHVSAVKELHSAPGIVDVFLQSVRPNFIL